MLYQVVADEMISQLPSDSKGALFPFTIFYEDYNKRAIELRPTEQAYEFAYSNIPDAGAQHAIFQNQGARSTLSIVCGPFKAIGTENRDNVTRELKRIIKTGNEKFVTWTPSTSELFEAYGLAEIRKFVKLRQRAAVAFGSGLYVENPLQFKCPLCGKPKQLVHLFSVMLL